MAPAKLTTFSIDQQPPVPVDEYDFRVFKLLDAANHNRVSLYTVPGQMPVHNELSHIEVQVSGTLPDDLEGVYLRNGTNIQFTPTNIRLHSFSGAGMIHQVQIRNGTATYSNFYVRTPRFEIERKIGREVFVEFSDIAGAGTAALEKIKALQTKVKKGLVPEFSQYELTPGSTSIRYHSGRLYCLQETGYAFVLEAHRCEDSKLMLDGRGHLETWNGEWEGPFSAHPRFDPVTGDMYNLSLGDKSVIMAGRISKGLWHSQASFDQTNGEMSWLHDFFLTENYIIFPDISMRRDFSGLSKEVGSIFSFEHKYPMRWGIIPRKFESGDQVQWFTTQNPSSIWHVINGWEKTGPNGSRQIILFSPCFEDYPPDVPIHTPAEPHAKVKTWTLDLDSGKVVDEQVLLDHHYERPSLNLDYVGLPSRYCYLLDEECDGYMGKGVLKYDMIAKKEVAYFSYGDMYGGEAYYVPKSNARSEDDGYLLDILMTGENSELIVIDATAMKELARLHLPQRVPFGVHATWLTKDEVTSL
ncbi:carotenoid cleavage dioxygenase [Zopfia rhizophila CBS 207.26]|uniref:Carotenoid cleavage dioxygenase n=1 Tax=Zopfia rhizophila CBS 207.26 TaxID=1314779 RepID=A0A6A6EBK7_9PEZI|nr:carotenoid cleavage dioxygenase [Zopfia rhizophila CBS 207.26]